MLTKSQKIIALFNIWIFSVLIVLSAAGRLEYDYLFALAVIGFTGIVEFSGPFVSRPGWRVRMNYVIISGVIIFSAITLVKAYNIIL